mgnify:CR=1 FL=1
MNLASDFSHIFMDVMRGIFSDAAQAGWGRGGQLAQPSDRGEAFSTSGEIPDSQGKTRSTIPKYALYSPAMHCRIIRKNRFPHGMVRG